MNSLNSMHNFKKKISVVASATKPFWENSKTTISYTTYTNAPSNYVNAGTGLTGSNQAVVYDYSVVATNNTFDGNNDSKEFRQIGNFWTIVLMNNVGWYPQVWTPTELNNSYSQDSTAPCILVSFYKIEWTDVTNNLYFTAQTSTWLRSFDLSSNFHLIYDPNDDGNAPTDSSNNVYHWYDLRISNINGDKLMGIIDTLVQDISFNTQVSANSTVKTDTGVNLRNLPFGTIAPNDPNNKKDRIATTTGGVTDVYDRSPSDPVDQYDGYITIYNDYQDYSIVVTRYTNESLPQILKTRLFS